MSMIEERRRSTRYPVVGGQLAILPVSLSVLLLDISLSGVMVQSHQPAKEGARGQLRLDLAGRPLSAEVEVRRVAPGPGGHAFKVGARFVALSDEHRQMIESFTNR